jgi:hypothetical protein
MNCGKMNMLLSKVDKYFNETLKKSLRHKDYIEITEYKNTIYLTNAKSLISIIKTNLNNKALRRVGTLEKKKNIDKSIFDKIVDNLYILLCKPNQKLILTILDKLNMTILLINDTYINLISNNINQIIINCLNYNIIDIINYLEILNNSSDINWKSIYENDFGANKNITNYMNAYMSYSEYIDFKNNYNVNIIDSNYDNHQIIELSLIVNNLPLEVCNFISLKKLDLSNNSILKLPIEFDNLINLTDLNLSCNLLSDIRYPFVNLKKFNIASNRFTSVDWYSIMHYIYLEELNISFNNIESLAPSIINLSKLKKLIINRQLNIKIYNILIKLFNKGVDIIQL